MFCCVASVTLVVLALCASTASAGFDWAAVSSKGSMQTGDVRLFLLLSVERERERDHQQQRVFLARGDRKNAPNRETVRGRPPRLSSALSETPAGALFVFDARKFADSFSTSTSVRVSLSSSSLSLSLSLSPTSTPPQPKTGHLLRPRGRARFAGRLLLLRELCQHKQPPLDQGQLQHHRLK